MKKPQPKQEIVITRDNDTPSIIDVSIYSNDAIEFTNVMRELGSVHVPYSERSHSYMLCIYNTFDYDEVFAYLTECAEEYNSIKQCCILLSCLSVKNLQTGFFIPIDTFSITWYAAL